jgi:hypothetical protein
LQDLETEIAETYNVVMTYRSMKARPSESQRISFARDFIEAAEQQELPKFSDAVTVSLSQENWSTPFPVGVSNPIGPDTRLLGWNQMQAGHRSAAALVQLMHEIQAFVESHQAGLQRLEAVGIFITGSDLATARADQFFHFTHQLIDEVQTRNLWRHTESEILIRVIPENHNPFADVYSPFGMDVEELGAECSFLCDGSRQVIRAGHRSHQGVVDLLVESYGYMEGKPGAAVSID